MYDGKRLNAMNLNVSSGYTSCAHFGRLKMLNGMSTTEILFKDRYFFCFSNTLALASFQFQVLHVTFERLSTKLNFHQNDTLDN